MSVVILMHDACDLGFKVQGGAIPATNGSVVEYSIRAFVFRYATPTFNADYKFHGALLLGQTNGVHRSWDSRCGRSAGQGGFPRILCYRRNRLRKCSLPFRLRKVCRQRFDSIQSKVSCLLSPYVEAGDMLSERLLNPLREGFSLGVNMTDETLLRAYVTGVGHAVWLA